METITTTVTIVEIDQCNCYGQDRFKHEFEIRKVTLLTSLKVGDKISGSIHRDADNQSYYINFIEKVS